MSYDYVLVTFVPFTDLFYSIYIPIFSDYSSVFSFMPNGASIPNFSSLAVTFGVPELSIILVLGEAPPKLKVLTPY